MPKRKTKNSIADRVKITNNGKVMTKRCGQGHFNAKDPGKKTRKKRRNTKIDKVEHDVIKQNVQK